MTVRTRRGRLASGWPREAKEGVERGDEQHPSGAQDERTANSRVATGRRTAFSTPVLVGTPAHVTRQQRALECQEGLRLLTRVLARSRSYLGAVVTAKVVDHPDSDHSTLEALGSARSSAMSVRDSRAREGRLPDLVVGPRHLLPTALLEMRLGVHTVDLLRPVSGFPDVRSVGDSYTVTDAQVTCTFISDEALSAGILTPDADVRIVDFEDWPYERAVACVRRTARDEQDSGGSSSRSRCGSHHRFAPVTFEG